MTFRKRNELDASPEARARAAFNRIGRPDLAKAIRKVAAQGEVSPEDMRDKLMIDGGDAAEVVNRIHSS